MIFKKHSIIYKFTLLNVLSKKVRISNLVAGIERI